MAYELRLGRWQDVLADVECDALICDPPYSSRTHDGARTTTDTKHCEDQIKKAIAYQSVTEDWVGDFVSAWAPRVRHWAVIFGDHISYRWFESAFNAAGWVTFAPIPWVRTNATPRFQGDGPQNSCDWMAVARPRKRVRDAGSRVGFYEHQIDTSTRIVGGAKPLGLMRAVVRDYSRPGDLICDPCAGGATTLLAAVSEGRRAIGAEMDPATHAKALARLQRGYTPPLFVEDRPAPEQQELLP